MAEHKKYNQDPAKEEHKHQQQQRPMGVPYTLEEIEKIKGHLDEDEFYITDDGKTYFDPWGYRFDIDESDGHFYDEFGGYYDDYGYYVPGPEYQDEYYRNYAGEEDEEIDAYLEEDDEEEENGEESKATDKTKEELLHEEFLCKSILPM